MEYDSMIDDNPIVQERVERAIAHGKLRGLQRAVVDVVQDEFPSLRKLAKKKAVSIDKPEDLRLLIRLIYKAPNKKIARWLLNNYVCL